MNVDTTDLAYAAGFLDGEGNFRINRAGSGTTVRATNTYRPVLEWLQSKFGGTVKSRGGSIKPAYVWSVHGPHAAHVCRMLIPYLQEKRSQAELILEWRTTLGARGRKISAEHQAIKQRIRDAS